jgi:L-ascorbate metabolism protein UlaG (beta-lactamase superfamily)
MIDLISQSALRIKTNDNKIIYFDPFNIDSDVKGDYIFITHPHYDHYSPEDITKIKKDTTKIVAPLELKSNLIELGFTKDNIILVEPNKNYIVDTIEFSTIPAYNIIKPFHPKRNNWIGYIVTYNNISYYVAGDTDKTEDNEKVHCDVALVPIGGHYTMDVKEATELVKIINPKVVIPTHYGSIVGSLEDGNKLKDNLSDTNIEVIQKL